MEKDREDIIDRVRKFLALSRSDNPHESSTAAAMATKMMFEHKLKMADLEGRDSRTGDVCINNLPEGDYSSVWEFSLLEALSRAYFCRSMREGVPDAGVWDRAWIVGRKEDAEVVTLLFDHFKLAIIRASEEQTKNLTLPADLPGTTVLAERAYARLRRHQANATAGVRENFCLGATKAITDRVLHERERWTRNNERAMVLVRNSRAENEAFIDQHFADASLRVAPATVILDKREAASAMGYAAGRKIPMPACETVPELASGTGRR
jgi:hypothetical protein